jgi:undecaprenyl-diphosphatase
MTSLSLYALSLVQAVTEFIPVSSSGHLTLAQSWLGLVPSLGLDVFLNTATLVSVAFYFWPKFKTYLGWLVPLIIGSIPAAIVGYLGSDTFDRLFSSTSSLKLTFLITSLFLISTRWLKTQDLPLSWWRALVIGLFQAVAILPGVSRSGATIFAGLLVGLSPLNAFRFSFGLFVPASIGAIFLKRDSIAALALSVPQAFLSFALTALVGFMALRLLENVVTSRRLWLFGLYTLALSLVLWFI